MRVRIGAAVVALACALCIALQLHADERWTFDGFAYTLRAELDAGIPYARAHATARALYARRAAFATPAQRAWLDAPEPQWWRLFAVRAIYPWLASRLWPWLGAQSLFAISGLAYVAAGLALYAMLLRFARPSIAAGCALLTMLLPESRLIGRSNLTDMLGDALWIATLLAMMRYADRPRSGALFVVALAATALAFTRPVPYMPLVSALALAAAGYPRRALPLIALLAALCALVVGVMWAAHADVPTTPAYLAQLRAAGVVTLEWFVGSLAGPLGLYALVAARGRSDVALALGACASALPTLLLNPLPTDVLRVVALPLLPVVACGVALAAERAASHQGVARGDEYMTACSGSVSTLAERRSRSPRSTSAARR
ncbi:MAG: hypothetical protein KGN02_14585 [bacterium]|nr:hypothetical protein [bacterium]